MQLKRTLSLTLLTFYGLGTILGAGIYALIGEVAREAQTLTPFSFLLAALIAFFNAFSYAELSSRFPNSAGSALYVRKAFECRWLSALVGWTIVLTGVTSAAALSHGFANYLGLFFPGMTHISVPLIVLLLGALTLLGIRQSVSVMMIMTLIEVAGLLLVIVYGPSQITAKAILVEDFPPLSSVAIGAFIAFYAYIGFEDMVNMAEETINPQKTVPLAIFLSLLGSTLLYLLVSWVMVITLNEGQLRQGIPLVQMISHQPILRTLFPFIAMISIINGVLAQLIMGSRMIYGMAKQEDAPKVFSSIYVRTHTPAYATGFVLILILLFAYVFPMDQLAKLTSTIILCIFMTIHVALIKIKRSSKVLPIFSVPMIFPVMALILSATFLLLQFISSH